MLYVIDKDGTLVIPASGNKFVQHPQDQVLIPGTIELLDRLKSEGSTIVIASNQGGIAAQHKSLDDTFAEFRYCLELCPQVTDAYFCPDFEGEVCWRVWGDCREEHRIEYDAANIEFYSGLQGQESNWNFRKPAPGMIQLAMAIESVGEAEFCGDRPEDEQAAAAAGIPFRWVWDANPQYPAELRGR